MKVCRMRVRCRDRICNNRALSEKNGHESFPLCQVVGQRYRLMEKNMIA